MASFQKSIIVGHLGRDPETRYLPNGDAVASFSVAVTESWKDKSGNKQERAIWFNVSAFGKLAEICSQYLTKGAPVLIEGKITTSKYTDKSGVERDGWGLRADSMQMLGGKSDAAQRPAGDKPQSNSTADFDDDSIPF